MVSSLSSSNVDAGMLTFSQMDFCSFNTVVYLYDFRNHYNSLGLQEQSPPLLIIDVLNAKTYQ
jgi:hypothetical protein